MLPSSQQRTSPAVQFGVCGAKSALVFLPLTDISTFICVLLLYWTNDHCPRNASSKHPRLVPLPAGQHDVPDGERIAIEDSIRHIGDQLVAADVVENDLDEIALILDRPHPARYPAPAAAIAALRPPQADVVPT